MLEVLNWAYRSVSRRGILRTGKVAGSVLIDYTFDFWYGTETMNWVALEDLGANGEHAVSYRATKAGPLRKLIRKLDLPRDCAFVDLGSGKGRTLLIAAQLGFEKVVGVEFSPRLCAIARKNVDILRRQIRITSYIEVINEDVARFKLTPERSVYYAYNPFDETVLASFVANLYISLKRFPRPVWFIYNTPIHHGFIDRSGLFAKAQDFEIGGVEFKVYKNCLTN